MQTFNMYKFIIPNIIMFLFVVLLTFILKHFEKFEFQRFTDRVQYTQPGRGYR